MYNGTTTCSSCGRIFSSMRGLNVHKAQLSPCKKKEGCSC